MVPCDFNPSFSASACWLPAISHALRSAVLLIPLFNADSGYRVNAYSVNSAAHNLVMGRPTETKASEFWCRIVEAWSEQGLPTSQNGIAKKLDMSQGSVRRWFTGDGLPTLETTTDIASRGRVCVEWILTGRGEKRPLTEDPQLRALLEVWNQLGKESRAHVLRTASNELAASRRASADFQNESISRGTVHDRRASYSTRRR